LFNNTTPTSSVFSLGAAASNWNTVNNTNGVNYVAYCFAPVLGYSAIGSYTGNGSTDGPLVYTGFRPRFVLIKSSTAENAHWIMYDTARNRSNVAFSRLGANLNEIENQDDTNLGTSTTAGIDILSNGFKIRTTGPNHNNSGGGYIYAAFAEHPFKTSRAR
jgi:hypothetical protein